MPSAISAQNLASLYPTFYNDMKFIRNPQLEGYLVQAIGEAVNRAEMKLKQDFGGWYPESHQFGINPLRPAHLQHQTTGGSNRWVWTSGTSTSAGWSNADSFIGSFNLDDDELMLIYGYFNLNAVPNTIELQIKPGNVTLPVFQIEPMRMKSEPYIIFPQPILVEPRSPFAVDASVKSGTTATVEEAGLLGYMFAPCSTLITR